MNRPKIDKTDEMNLEVDAKDEVMHIQISDLRRRLVLEKSSHRSGVGVARALKRNQVVKVEW